MKKHKSTAGPILNRIRSLLAFRHQNPVARVVSTVTAFAAALLLALVVVPATAAYGVASSCATPGGLPGGFEIDGDMTDHNCSPTSGDDWAAHDLTTNGGDVASSTQGGTYKTAFDDTSDPSSWTSSGATPNKGDFAVEYSFANIVNVGGHPHYFVYVAWERDGTAGTGGYVIEIDNSGTNAPGGVPQPDRSSGGSTYYLSATGSDAPTLTCLGAFDNQAQYGPNLACPPGSTTGFYSQINAGSAITDSFSNLSVPAKGFYEVALDVTQLTGVAPSCPGADAASLYIRSLTGEVKNGNLKGYMAPLELKPDSTCVSPTLTTQTQANDQIDGLDVVAPGTPQHDVATVTGTNAIPAPTGSVSFSLCGPTNSAADCTTGGADGGTHDLVQHATNSTAQSDDLSPTDPGWYCWRAHFTPDPVNSDNPFLSKTATTKTNECFQVAKATPTLTTQSSAVTDNGAAANSVGFTTIGDVATLSNVYPNANLSTQHVTFSLYGALGSTPGANDCVTLKRVSGPTDVLLVQSDSTTWTATAPTYKPTAANGPGYYTWVASYGGDAINVDVSGQLTSSCGEDNAHETRLLVGPQLTLTKGTPHSTITAGDDVVYDLNLSNVGDGTASNVVVKDVLPILDSGNTWALDTPIGNAYNCSIAAGSGADTGHQVVTCNVGNLNPSVLTQIAEVTATTTPADCGDITNYANLTADPNVNQTVGPRTVTVQCPGLDITKTADAASVTVGSDIGFTVTATNTGQGTASGVLVKDVLPTGPGITWSIDTIDTPPTGPLSCGIADGTGADAGHQVLTCTGSLPSGVGGVETVHVTSPTQWTGSGETEVNSCLGGTDNTGVYDNTATVTASNVTGAPNDSASEAVLCPDLHVTKVADAASVDAGSQIGFVITASNTGDAPATGAFVNDPLPTGVTWSIASQSGPLTCSISAGTLSCSGATPEDVLGAGQSQIVHITAATAFADCGTYNNTATFTATDSPQTPNDSDSTTVLCSKLTLTKTADAASVNAGGQIGFTVTASNGNGETVGTAKAVTINDPLPAGSGVDWSVASGASNCSIQGAPPAETLVCSAVDLAPGASESVHVVSGTTTASCQNYPNVASLAARNAPSLTANASTAVAGCVSPVVVVSPPKQHHPAVLPNTGGPDMRLLGAGLVLLLGGGLLVAGDRRRKHRS